IPLSSPHKFFLGLGSAAASLLDPSRGDQIALLSELSSEPFHLARMRDQMLASEEGRRILLDRPQINTKTVDMAYLRSLPEGTFGNEYTRWLDWCGVGPDTRAEVLHVDDPTLRYIMARNRQSHDMHHLLCLMPVSHLGETVVKMFEASHFGLPVSYLSALAGPLRLSAEERAKLLGFGLAGLAAWAWRQGQITSPLINVYWEKRWEQDFGELRRELGFDEDPP
ncbi:ubiquinone biosynthesis protein coq4, mitochondrial, partial [Ceraceosorus guamensis]